MAGRRPRHGPAGRLLLGWTDDTAPGKPIGFVTGRARRQRPAPVWQREPTHLMTIARTGAGKGVGAAVPALLLHPGSAVVVDIKGELSAVTARARREMGQDVVVLDPFGATPGRSDTFNPLDLIDIRDAQAVDDVTSLVTELAGGLGDDPRSRFWQQRGIHLVVGCTVLRLQQAQDAGADLGRAPRASLFDLRDILCRAAAGADKLSADMAASRHPEVRRIAGLLDIGARETLGGIVSYAQECVDFLRGDLLGHHLASSSFDARVLSTGERPITVYLVLPPHLMESHARLLRLWIAALFMCITRRRHRPAHPTLLLLDEAAQLGELPALRQAMTLLRGYGVQTWSFWQDASQLMANFPRDWRTLLNNCGAIQAFGANSPQASQDIADIMGCEPQRVAELPPDRMLLLQAGEPLQVARRPDYRLDPMFAGRFDPNPFFEHAAGRVSVRAAQRLRPAGVGRPEDQAGPRAKGSGSPEDSLVAEQTSPVDPGAPNRLARDDPFLHDVLRRLRRGKEPA